MVKITVACVGKIKEKFFSDAISEYAKRLKRYCVFSIEEVKDEPMSDSPSEGEKESVLKKEADKLFDKISDNAYVIALCIEGKKIDSKGLADKIESQMRSGKSEIVFVIGGSLGLDERIKKRADFSLSFSDMTFPHQLMRVILSEQIYRAFTISNGGKYHK